MDYVTAVSQLSSLGYTINGGFVICEKHRFGRLGQESFYPENDENPTPLGEIDHFGDLDEGSFGHRLEFIMNDRTLVKLPRSELPGKTNYSALTPNPNGQGFLMPSSISDLTDAWSLIFPDFRSKCWKEITTNYIMVDLSLIGENGLKSLDDPMMTRITGFIQNQLKRLGCVGRQPGKETIRDVFIAQAELNSRNAFLDMMKSHIWDKIPRLDRLFIDVFGARMPDLSEEDSETVLKDVCKCWFLGAVARQHKAIQLDIIPIMIGLTNIRKSSAVKWMATCDEFYRDPLDISEKRFVEDTKGGLVIELAEMKATKGMDNDYLKGFLSRTSDHIRLPYDRCASENIRRFVVIGTTNESEFLSDPTGNRRYFPFEVSPEKTVVGFGKDGFRSPEAFEYIMQVWAEAYYRYLAKENWKLSPDTVHLAKKAQEATTIDNPNLNILSELVDELYPLPGERICLKDLVSILGTQSAIFGEEAEIAAKLWWKTPHPDWSGSTTQRITSKGREDWLKKPTVTMKCRTRIQPPGYKVPTMTRCLGE